MAGAQQAIKQLAICLLLGLTACEGSSDRLANRVKQVNDEYATLMKQAPCTIPNGALPRNANQQEFYAVAWLCGWGQYLREPEAIAVPE